MNKFTLPLAATLLQGFVYVHPIPQGYYNPPPSPSVPNSQSYFNPGNTYIPPPQYIPPPVQYNYTPTPLVAPWLQHQ